MMLIPQRDTPAIVWFWDFSWIQVHFWQHKYILLAKIHLKLYVGLYPTIL